MAELRTDVDVHGRDLVGTLQLHELVTQPSGKTWQRLEDLLYRAECTCGQVFDAEHGAGARDAWYLHWQGLAPHDPLLPTAIIADLDGTLAFMNGRSPYAEDTSGDVLIRPVADLLTRFCDGLHPVDDRLIVITGREEKQRAATEAWLVKHGIAADLVLMRENDDHRADTVAKAELYEAQVKGRYNVRFVVEDRDRVVKMWRGLGLHCFQVAEGAF